MTQYTARLLITAPSAKLTAVRSFVADNFDPQGSNNWFNLCLSASGNAPATHAWACTQATDEDAALWQAEFGADATIRITARPYAQPLDTSAALAAAGLQLVAPAM